MAKFEYSLQEKIAIQDVIDMIKNGLVPNEDMLKRLMNAGFSYADAVFMVGYLKDNREDFTK